MPKNILKTSDITNFWTAFLHLGVVLAALYASSFASYILFHSLAEIVSIVIAAAIFLVAWNSRRFSENSYYLMIGSAFLASGTIDLIHTFAYKGSGIIIAGGNSNIATQLWLAGRYLLVATFLIIPFLGNRKIRPRTIFTSFLAVTIFLLLAIFYWKIFPTAYVDGSGLTPFKKMSEYAIIALFALAFLFSYRLRDQFDRRVFQLMEIVILILALTEFSFTLYVGVYDFFNLLGHLLKVTAYYFAYLGIVEFGMMQPYRSLFKELKDKEDGLARASEKWSLTFDSISDLIFILDTDHNIVRVNRALCDLLGKSEKELIGTKCFEIMHQMHKPWATCPMKVTCQNRKPHTEEVDDPTLGKVLLITTSPILNKRGEIAGIVHIAKDITERKNIENKIKHLASFPELNLHPVIEIGLDGQVDYANPAAFRLFPDIFKKGISHPFLEGIQLESTKEFIRREKQSGDRWYYQSIGYVPEAKSIRIYGTDITERKRIEHSKDEFISLASHQLRTPLSSISLASELLTRQSAKDTDPEQKELAEEIFRSTKRMSALINHMLNVSRIEMGTLAINPLPLDLRKSAEDIIEELQSQITEKNIILKKNTGGEPLIVRFDENILRIILENILTNAIRYTPSGGTITVALKKEASQTVLSVSDTGCGIPPAAQAKIFSKTFRAENAKQISSDGHGLGLYMVKKVADKAGATIRFESEENKGTTFFVSFPLEK